MVGAHGAVWRRLARIDPPKRREGRLDRAAPVLRLCVLRAATAPRLSGGHAVATIPRAQRAVPAESVCDGEVFVLAGASLGPMVGSPNGMADVTFGHHLQMRIRDWFYIHCQQFFI